MPLPSEAIKISGGCNCSAIRYRISIPPLSERLVHPTFDPTAAREPVRLPFVCIDHCNDCRRATAALLGVVLCSPTAYVEMSLLPAPKDYTEKPPQDPERAWFPAEEVYPPGERSREGTTLAFYVSSEGRWRCFCSNCGTQFAYVAHPYPDGWPRMLDIWIGSVDQKDLQKEWLIPERHLWYDIGIKWIQQYGSEGSGGVPKHPTYKVSEEMKPAGSIT